MAGHDEDYDQALTKLLTEHLEKSVPDSADVWAEVNVRLGQRQSTSKGTDKQELRPWWRNVTEVIFGSSASRVEGRASERRNPLLAFSIGILGLALLTLITVISIGRLAERGRNINPGPVPTASSAIPAPTKEWRVIVSSDFTDVMPLLIGNPADGQRIKPFGSLAVGDDGNFWFLDGNEFLELSADGATTIKTISLDTRIRPSETTYLDSFNGLALQGSNFWVLDGEAVYQVAMDGSLVAEHHPLPVPIGASTSASVPALWLRAGENGQMLIEQTDGTYMKADRNASADTIKPQPTPFPGYPSGGKFYSYGTAPNEIMAGGVPATIDVPGTINGRHILKVLPDGSFYVLVEAVAYPPNTVEGAYTYVMHYAVDGKLIERARLFSPLGAQPAVWQVAFGPDEEFYAESSDVEDPGRVDLVRLIFRPASEPLPAVPATVPTPVLPMPVPTIERPQVPSPIPSIPQQAPTIDPTPSVLPAPLGVKVSLRQGVSMSLISQEQAAITGVSTGNCGTEMTWVLQIENKGSEPFVAGIDKSSLTMTDNTGNSYPLSQACGGLPYSGSFAESATINQGDILKGYIAFQAESLPAEARYFTLHLSVSGVPVVFVYDLPAQLPTSTVSALNTPTRVSGSPPISPARDGDSFRLDVYEGAAQFGGVTQAPWIDASRLLVAWYSTSETPTTVFSYATYMVDTTSGKLLTLPGFEPGRDIFLSPDGNQAVLLSPNTLHVALYDFRSGALQTVADLDPSVTQWAGPDANLSEFKPGTEIFVQAIPMWADNDTFALTVQHSTQQGSDYDWDKALLVNIAQHRVRVLANRGTVVAAFPDGSVLVQSGRIEGEIQLFRPGDSSPITVATSGLWTTSWSISPDGKQVAWYEMTPPASSGAQTPPVECCSSQQPPALKDIVVFDSSTGNTKRFDVSGIAFIGPGISWTGGDNIRWGKDGSTLFYSTHRTKDHATLYRLPLNGQAIALVDMDKLVGLDFVAEGNDGSIYYTIIGVDCQTCVQLVRRHSDGTNDIVHANGDTRDWQVDGQGRLEEMKDGGILLTDLVTGQSHQVNFPGVTINTSELGMAVLGVGSLVPISPDGNWAAFAGSQSDAIMVGPDGRATDRGRTVYIVRIK